MSDTAMPDAPPINRKRGRDDGAPSAPQGGPPGAKRRRVMTHQAHDVKLLLQADPGNTYHVGQYGNSGKERELFADVNVQFTKVRVPGTTHESEHIIGYAVLAINGPTRGKGTLAATIENKAPAYLEVHALHRAHVGTGTSQEADRYRDEQRSLLTQKATVPKVNPATQVQQGWQAGTTAMEKRVSSAAQLNQMHYAGMFRQAEAGAGNVSYSTTNTKGVVKDRTKPFSPEFEEQLKVANTSYQAMTVNLSSVSIVENDGVTTQTINVTQIERCEIDLARIAVVTGRMPTNDETTEVMKRHGVTPKVIWRLIKKKDLEAGTEVENWTKFII